MIRELSEAAAMYESDIECFFVSPERVPELLSELDTFRWWNTETNEILPRMPVEDLGKGESGELIRVNEIPVYEDRYLHLPIYTEDKKPILFYVRRLQENGINLLLGWNG